MTIDNWDLLKKTSRTFFLSIEQLPGMLAQSMCLSYLLLRVSDYLEDNNHMQPEEKVELLHLWEQVMSGTEPAIKLEQRITGIDITDEPDGFAAMHAGELIELFQHLPLKFQDCILPHVRASTLGMARWTARGPDIQNEADMDDYMFEVAGRVGFLITGVLGLYSSSINSRVEKLLPLASDFGLALQTVNVIRGLRSDFERGWIYIPASFCLDAGLERSDLFKPENLPIAMNVVDRVADKAEGHLSAALSYVMLLPPWLHSIRLFCIWPMLFAAKTLAISRHNINILASEVKITRPQVAKIMRDTSLFGWSNLWLANYYRQLIVTQ